LDRFIGLMSGTSLDGVDGVLVEIDPSEERVPNVVAHAHDAFPTDLRDELRALNHAGQSDELHRAALAANALAKVYAGVVVRLRDASRGLAIRAVGVHGQTVRHRPHDFDGIGYTLQINNPALLAELCCIDVITDFRSRDVAAGGQGAPLVPAFHRAVLGRPDATVVVLNLGGIANLSILHRDGATTGFDCGPANTLVDLWCERHLGTAFDRDGAWAASGRVVAPLLAMFQADPFFRLAPPKSTGLDRFNGAWLDDHLARYGRAAAPQDVQATLLQLTVEAAADAVRRHAGGAMELVACGGGAYYVVLMRRLALALAGVRVRRTDDLGLPANQIEAAAFAWLAHRFLLREPGNLPAVTGARGPRVLGALYPAH
jgi:anhydro-N-acetylmuramic acid kinase